MSPATSTVIASVQKGVFLKLNNRLMENEEINLFRASKAQPYL